MQGDVLQSQAVNLPEGLVGIHDVDVLQLDVAHLAEELRTVDTTTAHDEVVRIPDGRTRSLGEIAVLYECSVNVPPGVLAIEAAMARLHVLALLDGRLTIGDGDIL